MPAVTTAHMKFRVISLFAGIGGFDLGAERAGFELVAHVEKDVNCRKLLAARWPDALALDDVTTAGKHNLPACDVLCGGWPCQDLSVAGNRAGLSGARSGLFYEYLRIADELQPSFLIWENVPGLSNSDDGRDLARVLLSLGERGYFGACRNLDAQYLGLAQRRRRVIGVFARRDIGAARCAEVLSLAEGVRGHPAPSRGAREGIAATTQSCAGSGSLAACLNSGGNSGGFRTEPGAHLVPETVGTLNDGAHNGGGLNGQDAYSGRIFAVAGGMPAREGREGVRLGHEAGAPDSDPSRRFL